jgi:hypothetical protein
VTGGRSKEPPEESRRPAAGAVVLGEGVLTWIAAERTLERWGSVCLFSVVGADGFASGRSVRLRPGAAEGAAGDLVAVVVQTRLAGHTHVGAHLAGISSLPDVGEEVFLGTGTLVTGRENGAYTAGVRPLDGRTTNWLDPDAVRRCQSQTVRLEFRTAPGAARPRKGS